MNMEFSEQMAICARLRQLSSQIDFDAGRIYAEQGIQFEQRWFEVMEQLKQNGAMSVTDMVTALGSTYASVDEIRTSLECAGLIRMSTHEIDRQSRRLTLTADGVELMEKVTPIRSVLDDVSTELNFASGNVVAALDKLSEALDSRSLLERTRDRLKYTSANGVRQTY